MKIKLQHVNYMPKELKQGVLYFSGEFEIAAHLCACGCGAKIITPISPTEWSLRETGLGPTLSPSIGNWQQKCQSHYLIQKGEIRWAKKWTEKQILMGRQHEAERDRVYYETLDQQRDSIFKIFWNWLQEIWK